MSKLKKIIGILMTFVLCMVTFSSSFNFSDAVENRPKLITTKGNTLPFPVTIRDFRADYLFFQPKQENGLWFGDGMVENYIGINNETGDKYPVFKSHVKQTLVNYLNNGSKLQQVIDNTNNYNNNNKALINKVKNGQLEKEEYVDILLNNLFEDNADLNTRDDDAIEEIILRKIDSTYGYDSGNNGFFPMNQMGFENPKVGERGDGEVGQVHHNFHFTLESHTQFWLEDNNQSLTFKFSGDDDVWMYIDNKLVIDIGGIHGKRSQEITIEPCEDNKCTNEVCYQVYNKGLNKVMAHLDGEGWYDFDFFYIERNKTQSNLMISTNMEFKPKLDVSKNAYMINDNIEIPMTTDKAAYSGETLYYSLGLKNTGNVTLNNVSFEDYKLGIRIDSNGVQKKNSNNTYQSYTYNDISIIKKNAQGQPVFESTSIDPEILSSLLLSLESGYSIEIKSKDFLKYTVTDEDEKIGKVTNTVKGSAYYDGNEYPQTADTSVTVEVEDIPSTDENPAATIEKVVEKVTRGGSPIYQNDGTNSSEVPSLRPGDKVTFKLILNNETVSLNTGEDLTLGSLSIEDVLSLDEYEKTDWKFYLSDENKTEFTNANNFELQAKLEGNNPELELITSEWEVREIGRDSSYSLTNTATLYRTINERELISSDSVRLKIARPSLRILKNVVDKNNNPINDNAGFTITVSGNDGTKYNVKLKSGEDCTLENLKYGVRYTISELPVMNYKLKGFTTSKQNNPNVSSKSNPSLGTSNTLGVVMHSATDNILVTVNNVRSNDKWFSDTAITENKIAYPLQNSTK